MKQITPDPPIRRIGPTEFRKEYQALQGAINRCNRPATRGYKHYGARGITVCDRWRFGEGGKTGFRCFLEDMGTAPSPQYSIDRIDVNGNYEPGNCRWATINEQSRNKTNNRWLTGFGKTQLLEDWARELGIEKSLLHMRLSKPGATIETAAESREQFRLSLELAREIRQLHKEGMGRNALARKYGVAKGTIGFVLSGETWKEPA